MKKEDIIAGIVVITILIILIILIGGVIFLTVNESNQKEKACKEIGFENYAYRNGAYCNDVEGNLYSIELSRDGFFGYAAKEIVIYDYRDAQSLGDEQ